MNIQFKNKHTGFKYIKTEKLLTLLPLSDIKSLELEENSNSISHMAAVDCPIFYNVKKDKFSVFLPDNFLSDIKIEEVLGRDSRSALLLDEKPNKYMYFNYDNLASLRRTHKDMDFDLSVEEKSRSDFHILADKYHSHVMDINSGELVIFMAFQTSTNQKIHSYTTNMSLNEVLKESLNTVGAKFEFFKAFRFNNKYYMVNKDGEINRTAFFDLKKGEAASMQYLILPFSESDWTLASKINERVKKIKTDIDSIFKKQETAMGFDLGITQAQKMLLEDSSAESGKKKNIKP